MFNIYMNPFRICFINLDLCVDCRGQSVPADDWDVLRSSGKDGWMDGWMDEEKGDEDSSFNEKRHRQACSVVPWHQEDSPAFQG